MAERKTGTPWWTATLFFVMVAVLIVVSCLFQSTPIDTPVDYCQFDIDTCHPVSFLPFNSTTKELPFYNSNNTIWISDHVHALVTATSSEYREVFSAHLLIGFLVLALSMYNPSKPEPEIILPPYQPIKRSLRLEHSDIVTLLAFHRSLDIQKRIASQDDVIIVAAADDVDQEPEEEFQPIIYVEHEPEDVEHEPEDVELEQGVFLDIVDDVEQEPEAVLPEGEEVLGSDSVLDDANDIMTVSVLWKGSFIWDRGRQYLVV